MKYENYVRLLRNKFFDFVPTLKGIYSGGGEEVVVVTLLKLYYSKKYAKDAQDFGYNLDEIHALLKKTQTAGEKCEFVNTDDLSETELTEAYVSAIMPSVLKKYKVRQVFGSRRKSGWMFGRHVPALVVYDEETNYPEDVFPHQMGLKKVQIKDFLQSRITRLPKRHGSPV
jgi:hypothetical protein